MNLPNKLTVLRIILTPIFMLALMVDFPFHYGVALLIFIGASLTDLFDGKIARVRGLVTDFGKFLDPLADKMLTTAAFLGFIAMDNCWGAVWVAFIVLFREFAVSSVRLVAASAGGKVIAANIWGKLKTVFQMIAIIFVLTAEQFYEILGYFALESSVMDVIDQILYWSGSALVWISTLLCIASGVVYLAQNKEFISKTK